MNHRQFNKHILDSLKRKEVTVVIGARQVGKTTMVRQVLTSITKQGEKVIALNMDIEEDAAFFSSQQNLLNKIQLEFGSVTGYVFN